MELVLPENATNLNVTAKTDAGSVTVNTRECPDCSLSGMTRVAKGQ
jgi:hypothetical protein